MMDKGEIVDPIMSFFTESEEITKELIDCSPNDISGLDDDKKETSEDIIRANIQRANDFIDLAYQNVSAAGIVTPRYLETIARLIDAVTAAAEKLLGAVTDEADIEIRRELVALKAREIELKATGIGSPRNLTQNLILTQKEALRMLTNNSEKD